MKKKKKEIKNGGEEGGSGVNVVLKWLKRQSTKVKSFLAVTFVVCSLMAMKLWVKNHEFFFIASEATHAAGIIVLIYKLTTKKTCSGIICIFSLIMFRLILLVRFCCYFRLDNLVLFLCINIINSIQENENFCSLRQVYLLLEVSIGWVGLAQA